MKNRVTQLAERLYLTCDSLEQACIELGFHENDLTSEEEAKLYSTIFQCGCCGYWQEAPAEEYSVCYGEICQDCSRSLAEEEEEYE